MTGRLKPERLALPVGPKSHRSGLPVLPGARARRSRGADLPIEAKEIQFFCVSGVEE